MIKTNLDFVKAVKNIQANYKTMYVLGAIGQKITPSLVSNVCNRPGAVGSYNRDRRGLYETTYNKNVYGFDCVCLIKAVFWDWTPNSVGYNINGVRDINADMMAKMCNLSTDFSNIEIGEVVYMKGHIGVYIGDNKVIEATPAWDNCVQESTLGSVDGYKRRKWTSHGKLPWLTYVKKVLTPPEPTKEPIKNEEKVDQWKMDIYEKAVSNGLLTDPNWLNRMDDNAQMWVVGTMCNRLSDSIKDLKDDVEEIKKQLKG